MTLEDLGALFPKTGQNQALTGAIPLEFANEHLVEIRDICREHDLRRVYRGPRSRNMLGQTDGFTLKSRALAVMLYHK